MSQVDKLEDTITQLLSLARDTHDDRGTLDPRALFAEVEHQWTNVFARSGRSFVVEVEDGTPQTRASKTAVLHVVDTLLDNAAKHGAGTVEVCARSAHRALTIEVTDEGDGITGDPELIFQRRHRTGSNDERTSEQGPGIGLALARRLAEAEGGRLVLSVAGPRPRFSLILPVPEQVTTSGAQDDVDTQNQQRSLRRASSD